jgi:hypothetical protein
MFHTHMHTCFYTHTQLSLSSNKQTGGIDSGFNHVEPTVAEPHLYRIKGKLKKISMEQVKVRRDQLNSGDVSGWSHDCSKMKNIF